MASLMTAERSAVVIILVIVAVGAAIGGLARLLLPGRQRLSFSATVLAGLLGAGTVGTLTAVLFDRGLAADLPSFVGSLLGAIGVVASAEAYDARRRARERDADLEELLAAGESEHLEFKSSARYNRHTKERDPAIELVIARTIAAFANTSGGTLLIGVDDDGQPVGLANDLRFQKGGDLDRYELWLHDLLARCLGRAALRHVHVGFASVADVEVCRVTVRPADRPFFVRPHVGDKRAQFHVRLGNSSRELAVDEAVEYVAAHWPRGVRRALGSRWAPRRIGKATGVGADGAG
jgi:uncharacterized membrane protein YeaQ/YmgE (transglycosylase-associated protein family)